MRIYAACLASYNNGVLHGVWIDASDDVDAMQSEINAMLRKSTCPNVMVADYESAAKAVGWQWDDGGPHFYRNAPGASTLAPYEYAHIADGNWRDLCEAEHIETAAHMVPSAEEWAMHDSEDLGDLGEYAGLAEVAKRVALADLADENDIPISVVLEWVNDHCNASDDASDIASKLEDAYDGKAESWADFAQERTEETHDMSEIPEWLKGHIDWEGIARDFELGGDWSSYRDGGDIYFFNSHV